MKMRLDQVKDMDIPERSTMERRRAYKTLRETDVNYVSFRYFLHQLCFFFLSFPSCSNWTNIRDLRQNQ